MVLEEDICEDIQKLKINAEILLQASKDTGSEVNICKTKYTNSIQNQNQKQSHNM